MTLIQEIRGSKEQRFGQVHEKLKEKVFSQIIGKISNYKDAEEVAQEAWLKAWTYFDTFRGDSSVDTWMYKIVRNVMYDYFSRQKKKMEIPISSFLFGEPEEINIEMMKIPDESYQEQREKAEDVEENNLKLAEISAAMNKLPEKFRKTLNEFAFYGKQYHQIAEEMGVPIGTVMSRIHFAKKKIKKLL